MQEKNIKDMYNYINELLKSKYSEQSDRDRIISDIGELIVSETYVELLESIKDEDIRKNLVEALNTSNQEDVISITERLGINLFTMLENKSKQILEEVSS